MARLERMNITVLYSTVQITKENGITPNVEEFS